MQILLRSMRGIFKKVITKRLTVSQPLLLVEKDNFNNGTPSLAGRSLLKNSPPDCFLIHPLRSASWQFAGRCPTPHQRLCLWNPLKG